MSSKPKQKRRAHEYYMEEAKKEALRSNCQQSHWGAVLVNSNGEIIGRGFTYVPIDDLFRYCNPCIRKHIRSGTQIEKCSSQHAEVMVFFNALAEYDMLDIIHADMYIYGYSEAEGDPSTPILIDYYPCMHCAKVMLIFKLRRLYLNRPVARNKSEAIYLPSKDDQQGDLKYNLTLNRYYKIDYITEFQLWYHPSIWLNLAGITISERPEHFKLGQKYRPPKSKNKVFEYMKARLGDMILHIPDDEELSLIVWMVDQILKDGYFDCSEYEIDFKKSMAMPEVTPVGDKSDTVRWVKHNFQINRVRDDVRKKD